MKLKLADYGENKEKFERFLEIGKDFWYYGNSVKISAHFKEDEKEMKKDGAILIFSQKTFQKDEKDPLNRFNGLFDGRTYGNGRFVLVKTIITQKDSLVVNNKAKLFENIYREENLAFQDEVIEIGYCDSDDNEYIRKILLVKNEWDSQKLTSYNYDDARKDLTEVLKFLKDFSYEIDQMPVATFVHPGFYFGATSY